MMARNPFPADHRAVITVTEINVPELVYDRPSETTRTIRELKALENLYNKIKYGALFQ